MTRDKMISKLAESYALDYVLGTRDLKDVITNGVVGISQLQNNEIEEMYFEQFNEPKTITKK